jgi:hypothetical protein
MGDRELQYIPYVGIEVSKVLAATVPDGRKPKSTFWKVPRKSGHIPEILIKFIFSQVCCSLNSFETTP